MLLRTWLPAYEWQSQHVGCLTFLGPDRFAIAGSVAGADGWPLVCLRARPGGGKTKQRVHWAVVDFTQVAAT